MTNMPQQNAQMTYDSSNRMTRFSDLNDAESYQYAPDNKRIWRSKGCSYYNQATGNNEPRPQVIFYSVFGQKLGDYCLTDNVTVIQEYLYFGGRMVAKGNGTLQSFKTDRLHSNQDAPGGGFFPYGETKSGAGMTGESFATYSRDWHGLDYADQRWYSPGAGRFSTSDPFVRSAQMDNSASWNRYSYTRNMPIDRSDPKGLEDECNPKGSYSCEVNEEGDRLIDCALVPFHSKCGGGGGGGDDGLPGDDDGGQQGNDSPTPESQLLLAQSRALQALSLNDNCRNLFGNERSRARGWDAGAFLIALLNNLPFQGQSLGKVDFDYQGSSDGSTDYHSEGGIRISISKSRWLSLSTEDQAHLLLHELGHAFDLYPGAGGSRLVTPDVAFDGSWSLWNSWKIDQNCFGGRLGWKKPPGMPDNAEDEI